nr:KATNB1-like protein 1 [Nothobranchius furzeri]
MESNSEDDESHNRDFHYEATQYRVSYAFRRNTNEVESDKREQFNKKRNPGSRYGNNPGRVKRVVSCKRKTHHMTAVRRKHLGSGRNSEAATRNNETRFSQNAQQEFFSRHPHEFPQNVNNNEFSGQTGSEQTDCNTLNELRRDHNMMADVLFGRNLRLKVALTLWQRNMGELLTYIVKIQDTGVVVDFLPLISKCINEDSPRVTIGSCVDLFPLVRQVLSKPYEEYLIVGLEWISSVLDHWRKELEASGLSGSTQPQLDENFQVFNQQLWELWNQEPLLKTVPGAAGDKAKVVESFLFQLNQQQSRSP